MSRQPDRRHFLQASLAVAGIAGLGAVANAGTLPAEAARRPGPEFPPVPGMLGDRRANEFWYQFDNATQFHPSAAFVAALTAMGTYFSQPSDVPPGTVIQVWLSMSKAADYPQNFIDWMKPVRQPLQVISQVQLSIFDLFYRRHDPRLTAAFSYFAQGVLYDPRHTPPVHTMGETPPPGYHNWHVFLRAMMFLDVDRQRWAEIAPLNGFGWALQSIAKPSQQQVNPPLPRETVEEQAAYWLRRTADQLDTDFQSFPYPAGIS